MTRAAFIVRDALVPGTELINSEEEARQVAFVPGAVDAIRELSRGGLRIFIIMNAPAIAKGYLTSGTLALIHLTFMQRLAALGVEVATFRHCPHDATAQCDCRLPHPGMIQMLAKRHHLDLPNSLLIGTDQIAREAGERAGLGAYYEVRDAQWEIFDLEGSRL